MSDEKPEKKPWHQQTSTRIGATALLLGLGGAVSYVTTRAGEKISPEGITTSENSGGNRDKPDPLSIPETMPVRERTAADIKTAVEIQGRKIGTLVDLKLADFDRFRLELSDGGEHMQLMAVPQAMDYTKGRRVRRLAISADDPIMPASQALSADQLKEKRDEVRKAILSGSSFSVAQQMNSEAVLVPDMPGDAGGADQKIADLKNGEHLIVRLDLGTDLSWLKALQAAPKNVVKALDSRLDTRQPQVKFLLDAVGHPNTDANAVQTFVRLFGLDESARNAFVSALKGNDDYARAAEILQNMSSIGVGQIVTPDFFSALRIYGNAMAEEGFSSEKAQDLLLHVTDFREFDHEMLLEESKTETDSQIGPLYRAMCKAFPESKRHIYDVFRSITPQQLAVLAPIAISDSPNADERDYELALKALQQNSKFNPPLSVLKKMAKHDIDLFGSNGKDGWLDEKDPDHNFFRLLALLVRENKITALDGGQDYSGLIQQQDGRNYLIADIPLRLEGNMVLRQIQALAVNMSRNAPIFGSVTSAPLSPEEQLGAFETKQVFGGRQRGDPVPIENIPYPMPGAKSLLSLSDHRLKPELLQGLSPIDGQDKIVLRPQSVLEGIHVLDMVQLLKRVDAIKEGATSGRTK